VIETHNTSQPILGRYQPISELAKSPIGGLVMALDIPERRVVALRSLPIEGRISQEAALMLLEASRWVKGLDDPAVMKPLDVGTQEGLLHAVFLYSLAEPLRGILRLASFTGSPLPVGVALRIAYDTVLGARAVEACGASPALGESLCGGLIPDSVLVGADGKSRLCDVGIGPILRRTDEYGRHPDLLSYAAPEQLRGVRTVDGRSDVFTIGILLWEMLANRRLFSAQAAHAVSEKVQTQLVPALDSLQRGTAEPIPPVVLEIVRRTLNRSPSERYSGTTALLQALETQAHAFMATPATVQSIVSTLIGHVFESRLRAMDRAVKSVDPSAGSSPMVVPAPVMSGGVKNRDQSPRAGVTKNPPALFAETPKSALAPVASNATVDASAYETLDPDSLVPSTGLIHDSTEELSRDARKTVSQSANALRPPLVVALPTLPSQFDLPGAELFTSPGTPAVKAASHVSERIVIPTQLPEPRSLCPRVEDAVNPVGPTIPAPAYREPMNEADAASSRNEWSRPGPRSRRSKYAWIAIVSVVACAFVGGIILRRCTAPLIQVGSANRHDVALTTPSPGDSLNLTETARDAKTFAPVNDTNPSAADEGVAPSVSAANLDATAPSVAVGPKEPTVPAQSLVRRVVPRSGGKVVKGRGKIAR
jgi:serine/threonine protein kinase